MQIEIENESYFVDSTRITGKSLKKYLELSVLLKDKLQGCDVDKIKLLEKRAEFISTFFIKNISANYILNYVSNEEIEIYSNLLFNHLLITKKIDSKIIKLFPKQDNPVVKEKSVFNDIEIDEIENVNSTQKVIDIINSLYSFAINNCRCSYYELENKIDWFEFLDYVDYELNRKGKHQEEATDEDIFDKDFD